MVNNASCSNRTKVWRPDNLAYEIAKKRETVWVGPILKLSVLVNAVHHVKGSYARRPFSLIEHAIPTFIKIKPCISLSDKSSHAPDFGTTVRTASIGIPKDHSG
ncbi:MAG TPA: hypothetical protein VI685_21270 [Candidatus Angelobacter sp.]